MTEIAEMVSVALDAPHAPESCYFCKDKEAGDRKNELDEEEQEDEGSDEEAGNYQKNNSGMLGQNLEAKKKLSPIEIMQNGTPRDVTPGAHHLIPGNASLKKSDVKPHLGTDSGTDAKNVGYNVNSHANGVWLAANYAVRPWSSKDDGFKLQYSFLAMYEMGAQFHDAHPVYSDTVLQALNNCAKKTKFFKKVACPQCKTGGDEDDPPYALVSRLNAISDYLRGKLVGSDPTKWTVATLFTSQWAVEYHDFFRKAGAAKARALLARAETEDVASEIEAFLPPA